MKKFFVSLCLAFMLFGASAQQTWWVFFTDKAGSSFDPYTYFDEKALERYAQCGADLYDMSNYPLNARYVDGVAALAIEEVGTSRWMNAVGVVATSEQAEQIAQLPFVLRVQPIVSNMHLASVADREDEADALLVDTSLTRYHTVQVLRMQGNLFREQGIDGRGIRIAVFDGGFPKVNTHEAFKHLRDNGRILKTWNFPNRKENVYGWNSHGTMTLSCIGGRWKERDLGMATGAEYLLARTEVEAEPFKEEIWWQQAVEWADKNGANIISSSLGYGKDRYYTRDMDGTSYVARAANMAARKGMLVVCSAGNEADDNSWQYIVTPSDADSALCIGGITYSLNDYEHISFASFGPSADGRQKPNLCAIAHVAAASPKSDTAFNNVYGTSFSCPLVAGFAACAWQTQRGLTNMQLFDALQHSADLYPYCDYAFGYGVPQASYFLNKERNTQTQPTFRFETQSPTKVSVIPLTSVSNAHIFYKDIDDATGRIIMYGKRSVAVFDTSMSLEIEGGHHIVVLMNGYMADYRFEQPSDVAEKYDWAYLNSRDPENLFQVTDVLSRAPAQDVAKEKRGEWDFYMMLGQPIALGDELASPFLSPALHLGIRGIYKFSKAYGIGLGIEYFETSHNYRHKSAANALEQQLSGVATILGQATDLHKRHLYENGWAIELFQRVRFVPGGMLHKGLHWDLGVFGALDGTTYTLGYTLPNDNVSDKREVSFIDPKAVSGGQFIYGVTTRFTYDWIGLYVRYRLDGIGQNPVAGHVVLPRLEAGIQFMF